MTSLTTTFLFCETDVKNERNEAINRMDDAHDGFIEEHKALILLENWSNWVASLSRRPHSFSWLRNKLFFFSRSDWNSLFLPEQHPTVHASTSQYHLRWPMSSNIPAPMDVANGTSTQTEQFFSRAHRARHQCSNSRSLDPTCALFNVDTNESEHISERSREWCRLIYEEQAKDQLA